MRALGFDVGGTDTKAVLVDGDVPIEFRTRPTPRTPAGIVDAIAELAAELGQAQAIGLAVPGVVDEANGVAVWSENLNWSDVPFAALVHNRCGLPTVLGHDVRTGAIAESRAGAARGLDDVVYLSIGTGIAAGIVLGGHVHAGGGYAGEIGHTPAAGHDEPCACGSRGCLEAVASAAAIARRYSARSGRPAAGAVEVLRAAESGDADAIAVWDEALDALAGALAWVASVLAPEAIIIGGGLSRAGGALLQPLNERIPRLLTFQRVPRLVPAVLGERAGCIGAGLLALDSVRVGA
jgi:glucokinase